MWEACPLPGFADAGLLALVTVRVARTRPAGHLVYARPSQALRLAGSRRPRPDPGTAVGSRRTYEAAYTISAAKRVSCRPGDLSGADGFLRGALVAGGPGVPMSGVSAA